MPGTSATTSACCTVAATRTRPAFCKTWLRDSTQDVEGQPAPPVRVRTFSVCPRPCPRCYSVILFLKFQQPVNLFPLPGLSSSLSNDLNMEVNHQGEFYSLRTVMSREYSEQTLSLACISSALLSLLVGFLAGYCFFKRCHPAGSDKMNCGHAYLEAQVSKVSKLDLPYLIS